MRANVLRVGSVLVLMAAGLTCGDDGNDQAPQQNFVPAGGYGVPTEYPGAEIDAGAPDDAGADATVATGSGDFTYYPARAR
jgi:hypothetical protein